MPSIPTGFQHSVDQRTPANAALTEGGMLHQLPIARKLHIGRILSGAVILAILAALCYSVATNPNMGWNIVWQYIASPEILNGLLVTLQLTFYSMAIGILLGTVLAVMRLSSNPVVSGVSGLYIWLFRGTPLIVQIIFFFNISLLFPSLFIGIPFGGPVLFSVNTNDVVTPWIAGLLALSLCEGAYMSEIVRAGILSVPPGQIEAARTIGLSRASAFIRVVLPQAMRVIVPPTGNQLIGMLKGTSLVSVIAVAELLYSAQLIYARTYQTIPLLIAASIWYLIASTILTYFQGHIERYYGRGTSDQSSGMIVQFRGWWSNRIAKRRTVENISEVELKLDGEVR